MQCPRCDMQNQLPGTACSHCGRTLPPGTTEATPAAAPVFTEGDEATTEEVVEEVVEESAASRGWLPTIRLMP